MVYPESEQEHGLTFWSVNKKNQAEVLRPPGLSQLESDKKTPHEFQELKQGTTPRETGERKRKVSQVAINKLEYFFLNWKRLGY